MTATMRLPRRRSDLVVRPTGTNDRYVVKDPQSGSYFQIGSQEHFLLAHMDGNCSSTTVRSAFERQFGEPLSDTELAEFLDMAKSQHLVQSTLSGTATPSDTSTNGPPGGTTVHHPRPSADVRRSEVHTPPHPAAKPDQSLLYWRKSLFDPDRLFARLVPYLSFLWTRGFLAVSLAVVLNALWIVLTNGPELLAGAAAALKGQTVLLVWFTLLFVTTLHEFAHGLTLKRYGGEVREVGVLVMFFLPCLFCNVSDAWLLRERWKRLLVTLAGGYCDLFLWAVSVFVWRFTPPGTMPNAMAFVALTVLGARVFFNFNPFLKLDGYYLLTDWLDAPNLQQRGQDRVKAHMRRLLWGAAPPAPEPQGRVLTTYGVASWGYGLLFLSASIYGLTRVMWGWLGPAGVAVAFGLSVVIVRGQLKGLAEGEWKKMLTGRRFRTALWLIGLAAVAGIAATPMPDRAGGPFRVRSGGRVELRAPAAAVLQEVCFEEGEPIPAGAVVARLHIPDLASRQARKRAEAAETRAKLDLLLAGPSPAKVAELTDRVARAEAWHARADADLTRSREAHRQDLVRLNALVEQAEAEVTQARTVRDRLRVLREKDAISTAEWEAVTTRLAVARGQFDQASAERTAAATRGTELAETERAKRAKELADAQGELTVLKTGPRPEEIAAARASLARTEEEVVYLDQLADRLTLRAGKAGWMTTARPRERVGRLFQEGDLICEIEDTSHLEVEILMKEGQAARVSPGQSVELLARALPFQTLSARVVRVAPVAHRAGDRIDGPSGPSSASVDPEGLVAVYCVLDDPRPDLRPGMTGHARVHRGERSAGAVLSENALRTVRIEFWR